MTSGERMVWAAEFVRALSEEPDARVALRRAKVAVVHLNALGDRDDVCGTERAMLDDMLSNGADR